MKMERKPLEMKHERERIGIVNKRRRKEKKVTGGSRNYNFNSHRFHRDKYADYSVESIDRAGGTKGTG